MMPLFPAYSFVKLTEETRRAACLSVHGSVAVGSCDVLDYDALTPDPIFMGLKRLLHTGPIGLLVDRIDRWIEARDERRYGTGPDETRTSGSPVRFDRADPEATIDRDERLAA